MGRRAGDFPYLNSHFSLVIRRVSSQLSLIIVKLISETTANEVRDNKWKSFYLSNLLNRIIQLSSFDPPQIAALPA